MKEKKNLKKVQKSLDKPPTPCYNKIRKEKETTVWQDGQQDESEVSIMTTTINNNVTNYFGVTADDVINFEQEHSFKYFLCEADYNEDTNEAYLSVMFFGISTAKHDQFNLTSDEVNKYYEMHEHNSELVRAYEDYKKYVNNAA